MIDVNECRKLLQERQSIVKNVQKKYEHYLTEADNAPVRRYGTKCDELGRFCPSIITFKRDRSLHKGRILKYAPKDESFTIYEMNDANVPIRIKKINKFGCDLTYYFYNQNGVTYAVPLFRDTPNDYHTYVHKYRIGDQGLIEYAKIDESLVIYEKYDYTHIEQGIIECDWCYYFDPSLRPLSDAFIKMVGATLKDKINTVSQLDTSPKIYRYQYRIYVSNGVIGKIEEYKFQQDEMILLRTL